ncbi:hypothetical protein ACFX12_007826 [Malus domestica]
MLSGTRATGPMACTRQQTARLLGQPVLGWPKDQHGLCARLFCGLEEMDRVLGCFLDWVLGNVHSDGLALNTRDIRNFLGHSPIK